MPFRAVMASVSAAALFVSAEGSAAPAHGSKVLRATRAAAAPVIDGRLDDEVWRDAPVDDRFTQRYPHDGRPPSEGTEVRLLYTDEAIYVGVDMTDSEPDQIVSRLSRRDRAIESDAVAVAIASRRDRSTAYRFELNAAGVQTDKLLFDDTSASAEWDAVWLGAVARSRNGWSAEFGIPLHVLRFEDEDEQSWGFNVERYISRKQERIVWSHVARDMDADVSRWGHVIDLRGLRPKRTIELRPFAVARTEAYANGAGGIMGLGGGDAARDHGLSPGLDAKLGLTTDLALDVAVNPDFGQVEADQVVLNLTRFETFVPEKRPFFLEGTDLLATPLQIFHSRRIGAPVSALERSDIVAVDGGERQVVQVPRAVPIWAAAKLAGQMSDDVTIALVDAVTGPEEVIVAGERGDAELRQAPARHLAVGRLRWSPDGVSHVGVAVTGATRLGGRIEGPEADHDAYVQSVDGQYRSPSGRLRVAAQAVLSERVGGPALIAGPGRRCEGDPEPCATITRADGTPIGPGDVGYGGQLGAHLTGKNVLANATYTGLSPKLDLNDLGFVQAFNEHSVEIGGGYRVLTPAALQSWSLTGGSLFSTTFDGVFTGVGSWLDLEMVLPDFTTLLFNVGTSHPGAWDPFETGDGTLFERARRADLSAIIRSDPRRSLVWEADVGGWRALDDDAWLARALASLQLRPVSPLELEIRPRLAWEAESDRNWFYGGCVDGAGTPCTPETGLRQYRFGDLTSASASLTLRAQYALTRALSLALYGQLFTSHGSFADRRVATAAAGDRYIHRRELMPDPAFTGDLDGDDRPDDRFQDATLNVNLVASWEFAPGSILTGAYARVQTGTAELTGREPGFGLRGLGSGTTEEVLLLKLTYFIGR